MENCLCKEMAIPASHHRHGPAKRCRRLAQGDPKHTGKRSILGWPQAPQPQSLSIGGSTLSQFRQAAARFEKEVNFLCALEFFAKPRASGESFTIMLVAGFALYRWPGHSHFIDPHVCLHPKVVNFRENLWIRQMRDYI